MSLKDPFALDIAILNAGHQTTWGNLGYWRTATTYPQACADLARLIGDVANLQPDDHLLDVGIGWGEQIRFWVSQYGLHDIVGVELIESHLTTARTRLADITANVTLRQDSGSKLQTIDANIADVVISLDSAYHYTLRTDFFREAARVLRPGGRLALADIMLPDNLPWAAKLFYRGMSTPLGVPFANFVNLATYRSQLAVAGFTQITVEFIEDWVFPEYATFIKRNYANHHADYPDADWRKLTAGGTFLDWLHRRGWLRYAIIHALAR